MPLDSATHREAVNLISSRLRMMLRSTVPAASMTLEVVSTGVIPVKEKRGDPVTWMQVANDDEEDFHNEVAELRRQQKAHQISKGDDDEIRIVLEQNGYTHARNQDGNVYPCDYHKLSANKDSAARFAGARIRGRASSSNRLAPEDWPRSRESSRATRCWTATGSACSGRTLPRPCTCSRTRGGSICSSERALPRVNAAFNLYI